MSNQNSTSSLFDINRSLSANLPDQVGSVKDFARGNKLASLNSPSIFDEYVPSEYDPISKSAINLETPKVRFDDNSTRNFNRRSGLANRALTPGLKDVEQDLKLNKLEQEVNNLKYSNKIANSRLTPDIYEDKDIVQDIKLNKLEREVNNLRNNEDIIDNLQRENAKLRNEITRCASRPLERNDSGRPLERNDSDIIAELRNEIQTLRNSQINRRDNDVITQLRNEIQTLRNSQSNKRDNNFDLTNKLDELRSEFRNLNPSLLANELRKDINVLRDDVMNVGNIDLKSVVEALRRSLQEVENRIDERIQRRLASINFNDIGRVLESRLSNIENVIEKKIDSRMNGVVNEIRDRLNREIGDSIKDISVDLRNNIRKEISTELKDVIVDVKKELKASTDETRMAFRSEIMNVAKNFQGSALSDDLKLLGADAVTGPGCTIC